VRDERSTYYRAVNVSPTNQELMRPHRPFFARVARLTSAVALASCTTATDPEPIATISLQPTSDSVEVGQTYSNWTVTLRDIAGGVLTGRSLHWESGNLPVATVDANTGVVTAVGVGDAIITLRAEGKQAQSTIKVLQPIVSIIALPDSFDLPLTTNRTIIASVVGPNGVAITNRVITWSSSNPGVAVVSASGVVTAVSVGTTTITIRAGTKQTTVRVRVVGEPVTSVRILPQQSVHVIRLGQTKQLTAECLNASQQVLTGRTITWNSGNPVVATVSSNGLVTGLSIGQAAISATCDNTTSPQVTAQVTPVPVSSVTITPSSLTVSVGSQSQLLATARDSAGNVLSLQGRSVLWTSNNEPVAGVSNSGVVSGRSAGTANVFVSVDGVVSAPTTVSVTMFFSATYPRETPTRSVTAMPPTWLRVSDVIDRDR
jgi:trimeric autotransporter adhesin